MKNTDAMREEIRQPAKGVFCPDLYRCKGYENGTRTTPSGRRADGIEALFSLPEPFIYKNDLIAGSRCDSSISSISDSICLQIRNFNLEVYSVISCFSSGEIIISTKPC